MLASAGNKPPALFNGTFTLVVLGFHRLFYEVLMLHYWGATLGKMACGIKVVRPDGSGLGWGVSFGRYFMYNVVISGYPLRELDSAHHYGHYGWHGRAKAWAA